MGIGEGIKRVTLGMSVETGHGLLVRVGLLEEGDLGIVYDQSWVVGQGGREIFYLFYRDKFLNEVLKLFQ